MPLSASAQGLGRPGGSTSLSPDKVLACSMSIYSAMMFASLFCRRQAKVVLHGKVRPVQLRTVRRDAWLVPHEVNDQRVLHTKHGIGFKITISCDEQVRGQWFKTRGGHNRVDMRRSIGMPSHAEQHLSHRTIGRNRILRRLDSPKAK